MNTIQVLEDILRIIGIQLGVPRVSPGSRLIEDLGAESADVLNIIAVLEETFHTVIPEEAIASLNTPEKLSRFILDALDSDHNAS